MTACGEIRLLLGPFDDGELEPHEMEDVALHVVGCGECKAALEDYRALGVALRSVVSPPPLDNFARAVTARLQPTRIPLSTRVAHWWNSFGRFASVIEFAGVAAATAILTLLIAGPDVRNFVTHRAQPATITSDEGARAPNRPVEPLASPGVGVADAHPTLVAAGGKVGVVNGNLASVVDQGEVQAASALQEMVSQLGAGHSPSVAVWSEPYTDTTAVWVPDQP